MIVGMLLGSIIIGLILHVTLLAFSIVIVISYLKVTRAALRCNPRILEFRLPVTYVHTMPFAQASYSPSSRYFTDSFLDKDLDSLHHFEVIFIIFAAAFALEEYTASIQHGWGSK